MNRSPFKITAAVACAAVLILPLAGCGKDDKKPTGAGTGSTLSPEVAKYVADAEKICAATRTETDAIKNDAKPSPSPAELSALLARVSVALVAETDQLKKLSPPSTITDNVTSWLASLTAAANKTKDQTAESILKSEQLGHVSIFADADNRAEAIGVRGCRTDFVPQ